MERKSYDLIVGFFVLLGILSLIFLSLKVGNLLDWNNNKGYVLVAKFENIGGLKVRAPVKSAGVMIGRVTDIGYDTNNHEAVVKMLINSNYHFPKDTNASIFTSGLLGEQFIGLEAGGDAKLLDNNDKIERTQSAVVLEQLISKFLFDKAQQGEGKPTASPTQSGSGLPKPGAL